MPPSTRPRGGCNSFTTFNAMEGTYIGTKLKYQVTASSSGFDMAENDFTVEITNGTKSRVFAKSELVQDENNKFYVCFDTRDFGIGQLTMIITAFVPDLDFDGGIRTEVEKKELIYVKN